MQLQLQKLMDTLNSTQPHYIRCVKPNNTLEPGVFDGTSVMQQLRSGVSKIWEFVESSFIQANCFFIFILLLIF